MKNFSILICINIFFLYSQNIDQIKRQLRDSGISPDQARQILIDQGYTEDQIRTEARMRDINIPGPNQLDDIDLINDNNENIDDGSFIESTTQPIQIIQTNYEKMKSPEHDVASLIRTILSTGWMDQDVIFHFLIMM